MKFDPARAPSCFRAIRFVCAGKFLAVLSTLLCVAMAADAFAEDTIEFLNGSTLQGTVKNIREPDKEIDFELKIGSRLLTRTYAFSKLNSVTVNGDRRELTVMAKKPGTKPGTLTRTKDEIQPIIDDAGKTPPDWFESTKLNYPNTLDLDWPLKPPTKGWEQNKNMGQFLWSVVNENPSRWHSGIKLVHHCLTLHKDDKVLLQRDMQRLGSMYFTLLQDYPRAAFWLQKAKPSVSQADGVRLAECYWRLGNRDMALEMLRGKSLALESIKLLGDMHEVDGAITVTKAFSRTNADNEAYLLAGDALRQAGQLDQAVTYYQKVVDADNFRNKEYKDRIQARARDSIEAISLYDKADVSKVADGKYSGNSIGYNGRLDVEVTVANGRIQAVRITAHLEKQFYAALTDTPANIISTQSIQNIDATSGATITSQAIVNATARALAKGAK